MKSSLLTALLAYVVIAAGCASAPEEKSYFGISEEESSPRMEPDVQTPIISPQPVPDDSVESPDFPPEPPPAYDGEWIEPANDGSEWDAPPDGAVPPPAEDEWESVPGDERNWDDPSSGEIPPPPPMPPVPPDDEPSPDWVPPPPPMPEPDVPEEELEPPAQNENGE